MKKGFVHLLPVIIVGAILAVGGLTIAATQRSAHLKQNNILSSSDENKDSDSDNSESGSGKNDSNKDSSGSNGRGSPSTSNTSGPSGSSDSPKTKTETITPEGVRIRTETEDGETKTEIKFPDESKIKTETEEDRTRTEVTVGGTKVRLERRGDRVVFKVESEGEVEEELETDEILKIDERLGGIKIEAAGNQFVVTRNNFQAQTSFPLSIDLATNQLVVTTPAGEKVVTVLPDQAVQNMIAAGIFDRVGTGEVITEATAGAAQVLASAIELAQRQGVPIYKIIGLRDQKLLGFIPVTTQVQVAVSAETGAVVDTTQPLLDRVIDLLAF